MLPPPSGQMPEMTMLDNTTKYVDQSPLEEGWPSERFAATRAPVDAVAFHHHHGDSSFDFLADLLRI